MNPKSKNIKTPLSETNSKIPNEIPVLIVGGGPVGLTTSLLLSHFGIQSLLVEQHPSTTTYPKARMINARTMEIFRQLGIEPAVREIAIPHTHNFVFTRSLAGKEIMSIPAETVNPEPVRNWSPTWGCTITQEILEPMLLEQARRLKPAQIRFGMQLVSFEQHDDYVLSTLVHRPSGRVSQVGTRYLIGADGSHSVVREALGIRMLGEPILNYYVNILFRADLSSWTHDREINIATITNPEAPGLLLYNGGDRWRFSVFYFPDRGQHPEDFTPEHCIQLIRTAVGVPELSVELDDIKSWNDAALVAERFSDRRIFLVGDANHVMSPMGGFGMNVGIQDAHNLAWKLAAVLMGWGMQALLESYGTEREPASHAIVDQTARNSHTMHKVVMDDENPPATVPPAQTPTGRTKIEHGHGLVFGAIYDSPVIVPDGTAPVQAPDPVHNYAPNASPGSRAPHVWLERDYERISTLDLFGREFVILAGARGQSWCEAAISTSHMYGIPLQTFKIGSSGELVDPDHAWVTTYGVEEDGAVLVRPDGFVAWRSATMKAEPIQEIKRALLAALAFQPIQRLQTTQHM